MGLDITTGTAEEPTRAYTVTERLFVDAEGNIVPETDAAAASLFATPGKKIPWAEALAKGLVAPAGRSSASDEVARSEEAAPEDEQRREEAAQEPKQRRSTPADKRRKAPTRDK